MTKIVMIKGPLLPTKINPNTENLTSSSFSLESGWLYLLAYLSDILLKIRIKFRLCYGLKLKWYPKRGREGKNFPFKFCINQVMYSFYARDDLL